MALLSEVALSKVIRGGVLAGLGTLVLVGGNGVLGRFLSPNVALRAMIGAGVLVFLGVVELYRAFVQAMKDEAAGDPVGETDSHDHRAHDHTESVRHRHHHTDTGPMWALLLPLVLLPAAVNSSSANISSNRLFTAPDVPASTEEELDSDEDNLPEMVYRLLPERGKDGVFEFESANFSLLPYVSANDPEFFLNERVRVVGFVHREEGWPENSFVLGRLAIWCCAADAALVGMWVSLNDKAPPLGSWLEVEGTVDILDRLELDDKTLEGIPALKEVSFWTVPQPEEEYTSAPMFPERRSAPILKSEAEIQ